ncbi:hypothetical protein HG535_0G01020 [Zygotorulaspora mrakii]|uniref:Rab-GAP TBC domain-containing protein n=1 Tax=Zygotorulaspora mrakii TaxID=42260 RepID=A0A7H9B663_ZYGMR|nr:uncharacterized protein HG535_0G01020 [Zygotorulaspora mrakii]QLG74218.1 hypothetical protein HG535_0G01020 [Zygotorulaspora mrakii]
MSTKLLFCKAKTFIHPTKQAGDNVSGFLIITSKDDLSKQESVLTWIPESGLNRKQANFLNAADVRFGGSEGNLGSSKMDSSILIEAVGMPWSFSITLRCLYSLEFRQPSPNGWWHGSIILHSRSPEEDDTMPVLFFHDDICPSSKERTKRLNKSFTPFSDSGEIYWGGIDFRNAIRKLVDLQKTHVEPTMWLVNATLDDLRNFSPQQLEKKVNLSRDELDKSKSSWWDRLESAKWGVMSAIADATSKTGTFVGGLVKQHPLVKLAERNSDNPYVRKMLENPRVQEVQDDFDSARVYLAKWALGVKQQADMYQKNHEIDSFYRKLLITELNFDSKSDVQFTEEELSTALERKFPVTQQKWESFFDSQGRLSLTVNEVKDFIFHGGVQDFDTRKEVWLFLLNVYPWDSSADERIQLTSLKDSYENDYKNKWLTRVEHEDPFEEEYWRDQLCRIEKDVRRNDRDLPLYQFNTVDGRCPDPQGNLPETDENGDEHCMELKNPHLLALRNILVCYNLYNPDLGYVQGMADLLSPIYYIVRDEALSFWCFVNFMDRMERNFLRDQSGIRDQMIALTELCQLLLPNLSEHLNKCDSSNLFFCFRMLLVWFKREFEFNEVCSIWEIFLTDFYSSQFQLFFMLAILQKNSQPVIQNLNQFDQVLEYFNGLHGTMDWNDLMTRSELLFIRFRKVMNVMDKKKELNEEIPNSTGTQSSGIELHELDENGNEELVQLPSTSTYLRSLLSKNIVIQREGPRTKNSIR